MKKGLQWSFLIFGTIIGGGYVSGREIWLFFGRNNGRAILLFSLLFAICCYTILSISYKQQTKHYKTIFNSLIGQKSSNFYDFMMIVYLLFTTMIMIAGSGATFQIYQIPNWIGIIFMALLLIWIFSHNIDQVIKVNTIIIPLLLLSLFSMILLFLNKEPNIEFATEVQANYFNAISFTAVNILPIISVLGAVGYKIRSKKEIIVASIFSTIMLGSLTWLYNYSLTLIESEIDLYEMPIYAILVRFPNWVLLLFTLIIWIAIFTTAIGSMLGLVSRMQIHTELSQYKIVILFISVIVPISFIGFQYLIELIYPIYGILNLYLLASIIIYPIRTCLKAE